jgi:hypothetical protein
LARKKKAQINEGEGTFIDNVQREEDGRVIHKDIWCDMNDRLQTIIACLYRCTEKEKCASYYKHYDMIIDMPIPEFYLAKYGTPEYPFPAALKRKQKLEAKEAKAEMKQDKLNKKAAKEKEKAAKAKTVKKTTKKATEPAPTKRVKKMATKKPITDLTGDW